MITGSHFSGDAERAREGERDLEGERDPERGAGEGDLLLPALSSPLAWGVWGGVRLRERPLL